MEHDSSSPYSQQQQAIGPCSEPNKSNPQVSVAHFKTQLNITLLITHRSSNRFTKQILCVLLSPAPRDHRLFVPFNNRKDIRLRTNIIQYSFMQNYAFRLRFEF
jgi:hypothetical protein